MYKGLFTIPTIFNLLFLIVSSFTLPMLLKYRKIVKKDEEKMRTFNMLVTSRRQKLISKRKRENSNAYVKTTNQY